MTLGEPAPTLVGLTMVKTFSTYFSFACRHGFFSFQNACINYFLKLKIIVN
jgi:hypothetical protein